MMQKNPLEWETLEFQPRHIGPRFYLWSGIFLIAVIVFALATNSPVMAITFILIGIMGFITLEQTPKNIRVAIRANGITVDREFYDFENVESFWIIYEEDEQCISLKMRATLLPFVFIPLGNASPEDVRDTLLEHLSEEPHQPHFIDIIGKMLHIG